MKVSPPPAQSLWHLALDVTFVTKTPSRKILARNASEILEIDDPDSSLGDLLDALTAGVTSDVMEYWRHNPRARQLLDCLSLKSFLTFAPRTIRQADDRFGDQKIYYASLDVNPEDAQRRLSKSTVVVVGLGGLGCEVVRHLTAAGVGLICGIDQDEVQLSNLNRQHCYFEDHVGIKKTEAMRKYVQRASQSTTFVGVDRFITTDEDLRSAIESTSIEFEKPFLPDAIICCADEPVGHVECACLAVAQEFGVCVGFAGMQLGHGYWGLLEGEIPIANAMAFFRMAAASAENRTTVPVIGSASWQNSVIGSAFAGATISSIAELPHDNTNWLVSFDFRTMRQAALLNFSRSLPLSEC